MSNTLTGEQTPATPEAMASAAPDAAPATPATQEAVPGARTTAPLASRKGGDSRPGEAGEGVPTAPADGHPAPAIEATGDDEQTTGQRAVNVLLVAVALIGMPLVGVIGFAASYSTLERFALTMGFSSTLAPWVPIGIDASIVALLAADLVKVRRGHPQPILRFAAHTMTLVTVLLNASEGTKGGDVWAGLADDPVRALFHAVMPILFVLGVEAGRHELMAAARIEDPTSSDRIPLHRWLLSPTATPRLYRRMRLANVRGYDDMVQREQDLESYKVWLSQKYKGKPNKATDKEKLPMTMAHRGFTVEDALALPAKWEEAEAERQAAEAERQRNEKRRQAEQAREESRRQAEAEKEERLRAIADRTEIEAAEHEGTAQSGTAKAKAEASTAKAEADAEAAKAEAEQRRRTVERQTRAEEEAEETARQAAARRRTAEDRQATEEAKAAEAAAREKTAHSAREAERKEAEAERLANQRKAAARQAAEDERQAEEEKKAAAAARLEAAQREVRAQQYEDYARLSTRERNVRRVARMLQAAGGDKESVPLADIEAELSVGRTVASEIRTTAAELLHTGYAPDPVLDERPS